MKKKLTITGMFNDELTGYKDKISSVSMIIDDELDCKCTPFRECFIHRKIEGCVLTNVDEETKT
jgi:hypothetical protein